MTAERDLQTLHENYAWTHTNDLDESQSRAGWVSQRFQLHQNCFKYHWGLPEIPYAPGSHPHRPTLSSERNWVPFRPRSGNVLRDTITRVFPGCSKAVHLLHRSLTILIGKRSEGTALRRWSWSPQRCMGWWSHSTRTKKRMCESVCQAFVLLLRSSPSRIILLKHGEHFLCGHGEHFDFSWRPFEVVQPPGKAVRLDYSPCALLAAKKWKGFGCLNNDDPSGTNSAVSQFSSVLTRMLCKAQLAGEVCVVFESQIFRERRKINWTSLAASLPLYSATRQQKPSRLAALSSEPSFGLHSASCRSKPHYPLPLLATQKVCWEHL